MNVLNALVSWNSISNIGYVIAEVILVIISAISAVIAFFKNKRAEIAENQAQGISKANTIWETVMALADGAMTQVENTDFNGQDKLNAALVIVKEGLKAAGVDDADDWMGRATSYIEKSVAWAKTVNVKKQTKTSTKKTTTDQQ